MAQGDYFAGGSGRPDKEATLYIGSRMAGDD